ncbi:MAG: HD domain-containing protein, partial [Acetobacterium sp.]|nr:HD domain-containing protein [Acetobacterium sp.]
HQNRVSKLATTMAILLDLDEDAVETVRITGLLHDIGKMYVPTELLVKPTKLSSLEYEIIKIHSEAGYNILKSVDFTGPIAEIVYQHHCSPSNYKHHHPAFYFNQNDGKYGYTGTLLTPDSAD